MEKRKSFDNYWLDYAQVLVTETIKNLNGTFKNYNTYLNALTGFYLVGGATAIAFISTTKLDVYLAFIIPVVIVQIAKYIINVGIDVPIDKLDIRSPLSINDTHNFFVKRLAKKLKIARITLGVATFFVVLGTSYGLYYLNKEQKEKEKIEREEEKELRIEKDNEAITKELLKAQKYKVSLVKGVLKVEAKFLDSKTITIQYLHTSEKTLQKEILNVPAKADFVFEKDSVQKLIEHNLN